MSIQLELLKTDCPEKCSFEVIAEKLFTLTVSE